MRTAMRLHIYKGEDGYNRYVIQYLGWPSCSLKPVRVVNYAICYDFFERGELSEYDVANGTSIGTSELMTLQSGIIPERFKGRNKDIKQVV